MEGAYCMEAELSKNIEAELAKCVKKIMNLGHGKTPEDVFAYLMVYAKVNQIPNPSYKGILSSKGDKDPIWSPTPIWFKGFLTRNFSLEIMGTANIPPETDVPVWLKDFLRRNSSQEQVGTAKISNEDVQDLPQPPAPLDENGVPRKGRWIWSEEKNDQQKIISNCQNLASKTTVNDKKRLRVDINAVVPRKILTKAQEKQDPQTSGVKSEARKRKILINESDSD